MKPAAKFVKSDAIRTPPDFIIAFQFEPDGLWHLDAQWGKKARNPTSERSEGVTRITSLTHASEARDALLLALRWDFVDVVEPAYTWPFGGKLTEVP